MVGPKVTLANLKGFQGDPYNFKFIFRKAAKETPPYNYNSPCPGLVKNLGQFALGTPNFKGVLSFIPREGGIEISLDKARVDLFEIESEINGLLLAAIERLVEKAVDKLLIEKTIEEAELNFI